MDAIKLELGDQAVQHIFRRCNQHTGGMATFDMDNPIARSVSSDYDTNTSSSSLSDEDSLGFFNDEAHSDAV